MGRVKMPTVVRFFHGCVRDVVVPPYVVGLIYILGKLGFVPFVTVHFYDVRKENEYIMVR